MGKEIAPIEYHNKSEQKARFTIFVKRDGNKFRLCFSDALFAVDEIDNASIEDVIRKIIEHYIETTKKEVDYNLIVNNKCDNK